MEKIRLKAYIFTLYVVYKYRTTVLLRGCLSKCLKCENRKMGLGFNWTKEINTDDVDNDVGNLFST